jgi:hypothetical protein
MGRAMKNERRGGNSQKTAPDSDRQVKGAKGGGAGGRSGNQGRSRDSKVWGAAKKV